MTIQLNTAKSKTDREQQTNTDGKHDNASTSPRQTGVNNYTKG